MISKRSSERDKPLDIVRVKVSYENEFGPGQLRAIRILSEMIDGARARQKRTSAADNDLKAA